VQNLFRSSPGLIIGTAEAKIGKLAVGPLFGIERDIYQATLDQTKAQLAHDQAVAAEAQVDLNRYQTLAKQQSIALQQAQDQEFVVEQDKATVGVDQANVDTATINLGYTRVLAPFDGIVTNHQVDIGNLVGASGTATTLATIVQIDPIYVYFTVSEPQILALRRGSDLNSVSSVPVEIGLQDEEGYPHKGHLDYTAPQLDPSTGTLTMRAVFENKDRALLAGLFVRVRMPMAHEDKALLTRDEAIGTSQEGSYVLVVGADNVVQRKIVKTGQGQGQLRIIESASDRGRLSWRRLMDWPRQTSARFVAARPSHPERLAERLRSRPSHLDRDHHAWFCS
jgi:membrane fusion protein, multidrug efflux system